jgi:hypothetical protein
MPAPRLTGSVSIVGAAKKSKVFWFFSSDQNVPGLVHRSIAPAALILWSKGFTLSPYAALEAAGGRRANSHNDPHRFFAIR